MGAQTFGTRSHADGLGKYQLDVTACDVADLVRSAGGWLFDRAMAGWDVNVVVTGECDPRPLQILGVNTHRSDPNDDPSDPPRVLALAASCEAITDDQQLRATLLRAMKGSTGDVLVWGDSCVQSMERGVGSVEHELSSAARAFKGHALAALGLTEPVAPTEAFRGRTCVLAGYSDLTPSAATSLAHR